MKKAFIVLAHQLPNQINLLLDQIFVDEESYVFLHINKLCESIKKDIKKHDRLFVLNDNINIYWGSDEILKAIFLLIERVIDSKIDFEYVISLTGQDLIIKRGLDEFLETNHGKIYLDSVKMDPLFANKYIKARLCYFWPKAYRRKYDFKCHPIRILRSIRFRLCLKGLAIGKKKESFLANNVQFYKDYYHFALPIAAVNYILNFYKSSPFMSLYFGAFIPEECFFTTVLMMSPFKNQISFNNGETESISYRAKEENNHPLVLTYADKESVIKSNMFIARKFDERVDSRIIDFFHDYITKREDS